jgi:Zn-dependent protease
MRKGSYRLGEAFGIGVYVHWSFGLLLAYVLLSTLSAGAGWVLALNSIVFVLAVFACVTLHEYGHALAARRYGIETHDITLLPIGGVARLKSLPDDPKEELVIALAGPAVNVVIAAVLLVVSVVLGKGFPGQGVVALTSDAAILHGLIFANGMLVVFNMIPAFPMDGGRVLRALLAMKKGMLPATEFAAKLGKVFAVVMFFMAFVSTPFFFLTAAFLWIAGQQELMHVRHRFAPQGSAVEQAMRQAMASFMMPSPEEPPGELKRVRGRVVESEAP